MMIESIQTWLQLNTLPILLIVGVAYGISKFAAAPMSGFIRRTVRYHAHGDASEEDVKKRQDTLISMFVTLLRVVIWTVAIFSVLARFGIDLTPLLAGASVLGVALAFGAQSLIKDFLSGMFIILENQYRVGDVVELDGAGGTVEHISIRTTVIRDNDGSVHYVPNGNVMHAINRTMGYAKVNLAIAVKPKTDIDKLADLINTVGSSMAEDEKWQKKILDPPHFLSIGSFSDTALEVKIIGKTQPSAQWSVSGELRKRLFAQFKKHNIELAAFVAPAPTQGKKK